MTLLVRLGAEVDAILVTEVIPQRIIRIVTGAHGIDIETLHQLNILKHTLTGYDIAAIGIHLMTVGTFYIYSLAVDQQLRVLDLHLTEAHLLTCDLTTIRYHQGIEVRGLCRPFLGTLHMERHAALSGLCSLPYADCLRSDFPARGIEESEMCVRLTDSPYPDGKGTVLIVIHQVGRDTDILDMLLLVLGIEITGASHATQAPEVLVLMIGAVTPAERLEGNEVFTSMDIRGDVKLCSDLRVLSIAHILTVHPQIDIRRDRTEIGNHLLTTPVCRDCYRTTIRPYMIIFNGYLRWVILEMTAPGKAHIHVLRVTEAVQFPHPGDRHRRPSFLLIIGTVEIRRTLVGMLHPEETPGTVQRQPVGMGECRMYRIAVDIIHLQVMPLRHRRLLG